MLRTGGGALTVAQTRGQEYFKTVNKPAEECGLWLANLKIAEDSIPSLFAVFFPEDAPVAASSAAALIHTQLELVGRPGPKTDFKTHWVRQSPYMWRACAVLYAVLLCVCSACVVAVCVLRAT